MILHYTHVCYVYSCRVAHAHSLKLIAVIDYSFLLSDSCILQFLPSLALACATAAAIGGHPPAAVGSFHGELFDGPTRLVGRAGLDLMWLAMTMADRRPYPPTRTPATVE